MISENRYKQLYDYLDQLKRFPDPKVTQKTMAGKLEVSPSTIYGFLGKRTKKPAKVLKQLIAKYPEEYRRWPKRAVKIGRMLQKSDVAYFLNPSSLPIRTISTKIPGKAPIVVVYRGHGSDKDAHGALYDHMTLGQLTGHPTTASYTSDRTAAKTARRFFRQVLNKHPAGLPFSGYRLPPVQVASYEGGLLVIPGRVRKIQNEPVRMAHEYRCIRDALNRGQPMIGICAGAWRVWEQAIVWSRYPDELRLSPAELNRKHKRMKSVKNVKDHCYSRMLRLDAKTGKKVVFNIQVHDIDIVPGSFLESAMKFEGNDLPDRITVNSVHWMAVNEQSAPMNMNISARANQNPRFMSKNRHGKVMGPEIGSVEAFESVHGAPVLGIQWHPEGYDLTDRPHVNLLRYMAKAGEAYHAKRQMLKELKDVFVKKQLV